MSPVVSIITCTYNRAHLIGETIQSVLDQTFRDFEYIIVDDGSTDDTAKVVSVFQDPRIRYYYHERTGGHLSKLRNFGHSLCRGTFIAYIDSDDLWMKDKLQIQLAGMQEPHIGFSFTDIRVFDKSGPLRKNIYGKTGTFTGSVFPDMLANNLIICHTSLVLKRSALEITGPMDETLHSGDHDMVFFLSKHFQAFVVYEPMVRVRKHEQNSTASHALNLRLLAEHHRTLEKLFQRNLITQHEYERAVALTSYSFGVQLLSVNDYSSAAAYLVKSAVRRPLHLKSWVRLAVSRLGIIFRR